jgi:rubrerythrin
MLRPKIINWACSVSLLLSLTAVFAGQGVKPINSLSLDGTTVDTSHQNQTLDNLQTVYFAESNASVLYSGYAAKADEEGYGQLASIFRALSRGEAIHAGNCAVLIRQMDTTSQPNVEPLVVLSAAENLAEADATQIYENDTMYPEYIAQARRNENKSAVDIFSRNMAAEGSHHALLQQALKHIVRDGGEHTTYLVCPSCGYVVRTLADLACPVCSTSKAKFEQVR